MKRDDLAHLRWANMDDSHKFVNGGNLLLGVGCCDIDIHGDDRNQVGRSYRPFGHFLTSCKSAAAPTVFLRALMRLTLMVFGRPLTISGFILDFSNALRNGCINAFALCVILNCYPHILGHVDGTWKLLKNTTQTTATQ
jgi:hypothetical protein